MGEPVRLQKILAAAGLGSRRGCETFITEGRVSVDGAVVSELGAKADVESQSVELDGRKVAGPGKLAKSFRDAETRVYYALYKPKGTLCTNEDPSGRPVAVEMVPEKRRIFCVGRLDLDTEGLIILTNDGDLTNRLTHPRYGVPKTYLARVEGELGQAQLRKLQSGVHLAEGRTQGARVRVRRREGRHGTLEIVIAEGMNRQVRRMLARVELKCRNLKRIAIGPIKLGELQPGESRRLTEDELERLNAAIAEAQAEANAPRSERISRADEEELAERDAEPQRHDSRGRGKKPAPDEWADDDAEVENVEELEVEVDEVPEISKESPSRRRRVIDGDAEEVVTEKTEEVADHDESELASDEESAPEELTTDDSDAEDEELTDEQETLLDEKSTAQAVEGLDKVRPWEKAAAKGGKMWADRGDTVPDTQIAGAAAEVEREKTRERKERFAAKFQEARPPRHGNAPRREGREGRGEHGGRKPYQGGGQRRPWNDKREGQGRGGASPRGFDRARPAYGDRDKRERAPFKDRVPGRPAYDPRKPYEGQRRGYDRGSPKGTPQGHSPRPWEKTRGEAYGERKPWNKGNERERPTYDRSRSEGSGNAYRKPGNFNKPGEFSKGRGTPGGFGKGGYGKPGGFSKPGGFNKPRGFDKPGGHAGPRRDEGARKPWQPRGGDAPRREQRGGRPGDKPNPGGQGRPWEKRRDDRGERPRNSRPWEKREE